MLSTGPDAINEIFSLRRKRLQFSFLNWLCGAKRVSVFQIEVGNAQARLGEFLKVRLMVYEIFEQAAKVMYVD